MTTIAVICEYDPFHRGHALQLSLLREQFGTDVTLLALMSGNTVQRGRLAIYPKHRRAEAALACGADLILELPALYSSASAEDFATGAVRLLDRLGGVDLLAFGSETGELAPLAKTADILLSDAYRKALALAVADDSHARTAEEIVASLGGDLPTQPNDILGVMYLKALKAEGSAIRPFTYRREEGYSASEARRLLSEGGEGAAMIPEEAMACFADGAVTDPSSYEAIALHLLRESDPSSLSRFYGMNGGVAGLLHKTALETASLDKLLSAATSRAYPTARLRRAILSAVLSLTDDDRREIPSFTNLLGANEVGRAFLRRIRKTTSLEIVTKPADGRTLPAKAAEQFEKTCRADRLMALCRGEAASEVMKKQPITSRENDKEKS